MTENEILKHLSNAENSLMEKKEAASAANDSVMDLRRDLMESRGIYPGAIVQLTDNRGLKAKIAEVNVTFCWSARSDWKPWLTGFKQTKDGWGKRESNLYTYWRLIKENP